jgi:hypothetical protein
LSPAIQNILYARDALDRARRASITNPNRTITCGTTARPGATLRIANQTHRRTGDAMSSTESQLAQMELAVFQLKGAIHAHMLFSLALLATHPDRSRVMRSFDELIGRLDSQPETTLDEAIHIDCLRAAADVIRQATETWLGPANGPTYPDDDDEAY